MKVILKNALLVIGISFLSCGIKEPNTNHLIDKFYDSKSAFDKLIEMLKNEGAVVNSNGHSINKNDLKVKTQELFNQLDLDDISTKNTDCTNGIEIVLESSWLDFGTVYFTKTSCNRIATAVGYHQSDGEMIEVFGLGDDWLMWIDYDGI